MPLASEPNRSVAVASLADVTATGTATAFGSLACGGAHPRSVVSALAAQASEHEPEEDRSCSQLSCSFVNVQAARTVSAFCKNSATHRLHRVCAVCTIHSRLSWLKTDLVY